MYDFLISFLIWSGPNNLSRISRLMLMKGIPREPCYSVVCSQLSIFARTRKRREVLYRASLSTLFVRKLKKVVSLFSLTIVQRDKSRSEPLPFNSYGSVYIITMGYVASVVYTKWNYQGTDTNCKDYCDSPAPVQPSFHDTPASLGTAVIQ